MSRIACLITAHFSSRATTPVSKKNGAAAAAQIYGAEEEEGRQAAKVDAARFCLLFIMLDVRERAHIWHGSDAISASARLHWGWIQSLGIR
jgi:hypothetical protein